MFLSGPTNDATAIDSSYVAESASAAHQVEAATGATGIRSFLPLTHLGLAMTTI